LIGKTYLEPGESVRIRIECGLGGPRNVLIERANGQKVVRPFRELRRPRTAG
jgi:hypothetical protein